MTSWRNSAAAAAIERSADTRGTMLSKFEITENHCDVKASSSQLDRVRERLSFYLTFLALNRVHDTKLRFSIRALGRFV